MLYRAGINQIETVLKEKGCAFCLRVERKLFVKRRQFEECLDSRYRA